jgi:stearoyl-CoA desaturase (delta-9 desaturase)
MTIILFTLIVTHITIACVTLFLHRSQAHRAVEFHPAVAHFMRFWLWLTTGMVTKQWVAVHRKHHRYSDEPGDPHSPHVYGIGQVFFKGAVLYHAASKDTEMVNTYGRGTPDDWIEHKLYTAHSRLGIGICLVLNLAIFGWVGAIVWLVQMLWIPLHAAGIINGIGHYWGYRNTNTKDTSTNILPWGIWIGGEELHNNHHANPASARLSRRWFEFDIGWLYIQILQSIHLAKVKV